MRRIFHALELENLQEVLATLQQSSLHTTRHYTWKDHAWVARRANAITLVENMIAEVSELPKPIRGKGDTKELIVRSRPLDSFAPEVYIRLRAMKQRLEEHKRIKAVLLKAAITLGAAQRKL